MLIECHTSGVYVVLTCTFWVYQILGWCYVRIILRLYLSAFYYNNMGFGGYYFFLLFSIFSLLSTGFPFLGEHFNGVWLFLVQMGTHKLAGIMRAR